MGLDFSEVLKKHKNRKVLEADLCAYEKWALFHFHKEEHITNPTLTINFDLDITEAKKRFQSDFEKEGKGFTAFLYWNFSKALLGIPSFRYRHMGKDWYELEDPPLFIPVVSGGEQRFSRIVMETPGARDWKGFSEEYRGQLEQILSGNPMPPTIGEEAFLISTVMGNLPELRFTSLRPHGFRVNTGHQIFYFGQRFQRDGQLFIPLSATLDHSNADPFLLEEFLKVFRSQVESSSTPR